VRSESPRILVVLPNDYYLFAYLGELIERMKAAGLEPTVATFAGDVREKYRHRCHVVLAPRLLRAAYNRNDRLAFRILAWVLAHAWARRLSRTFDAAILPFDYRIPWNVFVGKLPTVTINTVTDTILHDLGAGKLLADRRCRSGRTFRLQHILDRWMRGRFLPRFGRRLARPRTWWWLDRLMGFRGLNHMQGFSSTDLFFVTGHAFDALHRILGVGTLTRTRIIVAGSPAYENLEEVIANFDAARRDGVRAEMGCESHHRLYSLFLSPSQFTEDQHTEVIEVVDAIFANDARAHCFLKFHPKTLSACVERFSRSFADRGDRVVLYTEFHGDDANAEMILASDCLVQKQSTVGFIAMRAGVPVLSYDLRPTGYYDDLYRLLGGSLHARDADEMGDFVRRLDEPSIRAELKSRAQRALHHWCCAVPSPCRAICDGLRSLTDNRLGDE